MQSRPGGTLAFSELLMDPDYPLASTLLRWATPAGFRLKEQHGNPFHYTLIFEKQGAAGDSRPATV